MITACAEKRIGERGFTLIEALAALALTGLVLSALATVTAQWLPNWNRGFDRIQQSELVGISMRRIAADLAAAEYVPPNRDAAASARNCRVPGCLPPGCRRCRAPRRADLPGCASTDPRRRDGCRRR